MDPSSLPSTASLAVPPSPYTGWRYRLSAGLGWVFAVGGLLGALVTIWLWWQTRQMVARAVGTQGTIVDFIYYPPGPREHHGFYRPIFTFADASGKVWKVTAQTSDYPAAYKRGDEVAVIYPAADPGAARIHTSGEIWANVIALGIVSGFLLLMGTLIVAWMRAHKGHPLNDDLRWWDRWFVPIKALFW